MVTEILHMGVEWMENHEFSLLEYIEQKAPRIAAFDLHWHAQSYDVMEMAKKVKEAFPSTYVLLGGNTASFFHEEIMCEFDAIDGIIRGEAETPILELANAILQGKGDLFSVPNLTWRRKGRVMINPLSYVASENDLDSLSFTNFPLLKNYPAYIRYVGQPFYVKSISKEKNFSMYSVKSPIFHLTVGRGCPVQCTWCSGGVSSQETISGRNEVVFRKAEKVLQSIREAIDHGYETFHICFDPYPHRPDYYLRLFSLIRQERLKMECFFESFGLPAIELIKSFKETFPGPKSLIILSPGTGSDRLRRIHKGYAYTNRALMGCLRQLEEHHVYCDLFFTLGLPFEKEADLRQTARIVKEIRGKYSMVRGIRTFAIEMEPGSPLYIDSETFDVRTSLRSFVDFYHHHSGEKGAASSLGYWIPGYFQDVEGERGFEEALQRIKCRHFCFLHPNARKSSSPFWGRRYCDLSSLYWKMKDLIGNKRT
jgi:radical SAM superfamily enzyme YgiQ (UPF0313 family)